jgi:hypothetical protein
MPTRKINLRYGFVTQPYSCPEALSLKLTLESALGADQVQIGAGTKSKASIHVTIERANKITTHAPRDKVRSPALCATISCDKSTMQRISSILDQHEIATIMQRRAELEP